MKRGRPTGGSPTVSACSNCGRNAVSFPNLFCQACAQNFMRKMGPPVTDVAARAMLREAEESRREALSFLAAAAAAVAAQAPTEEDGASPKAADNTVPPPDPSAAETADMLALGQMLLDLANAGGQGATRDGDHGREEEEEEQDQEEEEEEEVVDSDVGEKNDKNSTP